MTVSWLFPAITVGAGGVPGGAVPGVIGPTVDAGPQPAPLSAETLTV